MAEFTGKKFFNDAYSHAYVEWLEEQVENLTKSNENLRRQLRMHEADRRRKTQAYQDQLDFVPYPDEDRD